jgi:predicted DNA-binding ribbon-helix-helix protein
MKKKSISIAGHRTSISLEEIFWAALQRFAVEDGISVAGLIAVIDSQRVAAEEVSNLSSALRVYVVDRLMKETGKGAA